MRKFPSVCVLDSVYGDGSSTRGYFINDVWTFQHPTTTNDTANIFFGEPTFVVEGTGCPHGVWPGSDTVPIQLAAQGKVAGVFAHCLQGDIGGGGTLVMGNILEPNILYTPVVPRQLHYNVSMQNIAVNINNTTVLISQHQRHLKLDVQEAVLS